MDWPSWISIALEGFRWAKDQVFPSNRFDDDQAYSDLVSAANRSVRGLSPTKIDRAIRNHLQCIATLVTQSHRKRDRMAVNANYMMPRAPTDELKTRAHFVDQARSLDSFHCFLTLEMWAHDSSACPHITLPVEERGKPCLFGAPTAFALDRVVRVNNIRRMKRHTRHLPPDVQNRVGEFFDQQKGRLRSFAAFPIALPKDVPHSCEYDLAGVLNVDADTARVLGWRNRKRLEKRVQPFVETLAYLIVQKHFPPRKKAASRDAASI